MANSKNNMKSINISENSVSYQMESKKSLDLEILLLNSLLIVLILVFSFDFISTTIFFIIFYMIGVRVFMAGHDRIHTNHNQRLPRFIEAICEGFAIIVTPWDEPYDSIKRKHITHHVLHGPDKNPKLDSKNDPHSLYESGFFSSLLSCLFFEEIQLYLDIRDNKLTRSRLYRLLIYAPLLIAFGITLGWTNYLIVFLAMRLTGFTSYFIFSWLFHQPFTYKFGFSKQIPRWFVLINSFLFGRRVAKGALSHAVHHAWPGVPYNQLRKIDSLASKDLMSAPNMIPNGI